MVNLNNRKECVHRGCTTYPSFGVAGTKKNEFCRKHAKERMVDLVNNEKCKHRGCSIHNRRLAQLEPRSDNSALDMPGRE